MNLKAKLLLWNFLLIMAALTVFGGFQVEAGARSSERILDEQLRNRAIEIGRGPGPNGPNGGPRNGGRRNGEQSEEFDMPGNPPPDAPGEDPSGQGPLGQRRRNGTGEESGPPPPNGQNTFQLNDVRRPRMFNREGNSVGPGQPSEMWSRELFNLSLQDRNEYRTISAEGRQLRVYSLKIVRGNGREEVLQIAQETDSLAFARRGQLFAFLYGLPIAAIFAWLIASLLSKVVLKPVAQVSEMATRISENPRLGDRLPKVGNDELGQLANSFNQMTDRLQDSNKSLEDALDRQRRFTGDAAHELRTPLTSISLASENGLHPKATLAESQKALEIIQRSSQSMQKLTAMLLSLSRLDNSESGIPTTKVDLEATLRIAVERAELDRDPRIQWEIETPALVQGNQDAIVQIASNFLENAAAYTPAEGQITIAISRDGFRVRDTGEGIAGEHLPYLFDRFYRADPSRSRIKGGHGLGLAISKSLAEAMGAKIGVISQIGTGSTFFVNFFDVSKTS